MIRTAAFAFALWPCVGWAAVLDFPANATLQSESASGPDSYAMPIGRWADGMMPIQSLDGQITRQAWRIDAASLTTSQIMLPLKDQLTGAGFEVLFTCDTEDCGGFDFRFATDVLPPPDMQVDLGDFRYLAALRPSADGPEAISLLVSRSSRAGYVQVVHVSRATAEEPVAAPDAAPLLAPDSPDIPTDFAGQLDTLGRVVMADLAFESGSSDLGEGDFPSLQKLADYLAANPDRRVALVGHTDSSGTLDGNIALSKRRAVSVLERLVADYGVQRSQIEAEGMGYLSPLASNLTPEGREINRRVEVIVVSTE